MTQVYSVTTPTFAGTPDEKAVATAAWRLMTAMARSYALDKPIRLPESEMVTYLIDQKVVAGVTEADSMQSLIDKAVAANSAIFAREENEEGQVNIATTRRGTAPVVAARQAHGFKERLFAGAQPVTEKPVEEQPRTGTRPPLGDMFTVPMPQPVAPPFAGQTGGRNAPRRPEAVPTPPPPTPIRPTTPAREEAVASAPTTFTPAPAPVTPATSVVTPQTPAATVPTVTPAPAPAPAPTTFTPAPRATRPATVELAPGQIADLSQPVEAITAEYGDLFEEAVFSVLDDDPRMAAFADEYFLEEQTARFSKNDFRRIRDFMVESEGPVSDLTILTDEFRKRANDPDYEATRFAINYRLLREKKDFEYVGIKGENFWTTPELPMIGSPRRKAAEIAADYRYLTEAGMSGPATEILVGANGTMTWEHPITFYEHENGVLPFDANARKILPHPLFEDQRSIVLKFDAPQVFVTYTAELHLPASGRGGYIIGLGEFFADNLLPGGILQITQTDQPNHFQLLYKEAPETEKRVLYYNERRQKFTFQPISFAFETKTDMVLTQERFGKLDNEKRMIENDRKRPEIVVSNAFSYVGQRQTQARLLAALDDLYPVVNIERPFSREYLRSVLETTPNMFTADPDLPGEAYFYKPGR